jgi:HPt (histidine-containing phosphotransfer) domain-containing protein
VFFAERAGNEELERAKYCVHNPDVAAPILKKNYRPIRMTLPQQPDLTNALDRMWLKFLPQMEERLTTLEAAAIALMANTLSLEHCSAAASAAHNLAGVLGTFGLAPGTDLARQLEQRYSAAPTPTSAPQLEALTIELRALIANRSQHS